MKDDVEIFSREVLMFSTWNSGVMSEQGRGIEKGKEERAERGAVLSRPVQTAYYTTDTFSRIS